MSDELLRTIASDNPFLPVGNMAAPRPGWGVVGRPTTRDALRSIMGEDRLAMFGPDGAVRSHARGLAARAWGDEAEDALALAAYYMSLDPARELTMGQALAGLPELIQRYGDGEGDSPSAAVAAIRKRNRAAWGMPPETDRHGHRLEQYRDAAGAGFLGAGQMVTNAWMMTVEGGSRLLGMDWWNKEWMDRVAEYRDQANRDWSEWRGEVMADVLPSGGVFGSDGVGDFAANTGAMLVSESPRQALQFLAMWFLGPLGGAAYIGADSAYQKNSDLRNEVPEMSDAARWTNAGATGLINSGAAYLMYGRIFGDGGGGFGSLPAGRSPWLAWAGHVGGNVAAEAGQEAFEQTSENLVDILTGAKGDTSSWTAGDYARALWEGVPESAIAGGFFGGWAAAATGSQVMRAQREVTANAAYLEQVRLSIVEASARRPPTWQEAQLVETIDTLADAADPARQFAVMQALRAYAVMQDVAARTRADENRLGAALPSPHDMDAYLEASRAYSQSAAEGNFVMTLGDPEEVLGGLRRKGTAQGGRDLSAGQDLVGTRDGGKSSPAQTAAATANQEVAEQGGRNLAGTRDGGKSSPAQTAAATANQEVAEAGREAARTSAPAQEETEAERRSRLERDAAMAEAEHEAERLAPHDPMETARAVNRLAAKLKGVKLRFFIREGDLPGTARAKLRGMGEEARLPRGLYDGATDTVWVNAALLRPSELPKLVLHEAVAHAGVRKVLGAMYDRVLDAVWSAHADEAAMLEVVGRYFPSAEYSETAGPDGETVRTPKLTEAQRREAADEFVARYADGRVNSEYRGVEQSWWREFKQRLRMLLARIGWLSDVVMDDREIETLLARAYRRIGSPEVSDAKTGGLSGADTVRFDLRTAEPPKRTLKGYKLMRIDERGNLYAQFIDRANQMQLGQWYDADSPNIDDLKKLSDGIYVVDREGNATPFTRANMPSVKEVDEATANGQRFMKIGRYSDGSQRIENIGVNGSGTVATFAYRPGWHATNAPSAPHIGGGQRRANEVWVEIEYAADNDFRSEAASKASLMKNGKPNPREAQLDHIPEDGYYYYRTNNNADEKQDWILTGSIKPVRILSDAEVERLNREGGFRPDAQRKEARIDGADGVRLALAEPDARAARLEQAEREYDEVVRKYKGTPQWMKAPNGEDSLLDERLWVQVRTPSFKAWFGDWENDSQNASKVLDGNGEPRVVYHWTPNGQFWTFDKSRVGETWNADETGFFFTSSESLAEDYSKPYFKEGSADPNVIACFLSMKNPLVIDRNWWRSNFGRDNIFKYDAVEIWDDNQAAILDAMRDGGHDGVIINPNPFAGEPRMFMIPEANQAKSATDNVGTYSGSEDDIRFNLGEDETEIDRQLSGFSESQIRKMKGNLVKRLGSTQTAIAAIIQKGTVYQEKGNDSFAEYAKIDNDERHRLERLTGLDLSDISIHQIDVSGIHHSENEHGTGKEKFPGQIPLRPEDYLLIPEIVAQSQDISYGGKDRKGHDLIKYRYAKGSEYYYYEEVRKGRGKLSNKTLYKKKLGTSAVPEFSEDSSTVFPLTSETFRTRALEDNVTPNSKSASQLDEKSGKNTENSSSDGMRLSLESYSVTEGAQAVAVLRPYLLETDMADAEACLEYLKDHGFRNFDLRDAGELMREADRQNLCGDAEAARESLERAQAENADPLSDGGKRVAELVRGMGRARKSDDDIRIELARLGVSLPQERLAELVAQARAEARPDARKAFRERRDQWLRETDPLWEALTDHFNLRRIYVRPGARQLGEEFRGGFIDPLWRRLSKAGQRLDERTRERLLSSQGDRYRRSYGVDVIAKAVLDDHPGLASDETALEDRILARLDGLTEAALDEEYRDARRREAAQERQFAEDSEAEWRKNLAERALRHIDARERFDSELIREDHELAQEVWTLLTGDERDVARLSEREIAAADAAIREGIEDAAGFVRGYAEGQRDLPQAVAEARKGDRAKIAERLRRAVERLENQYKEQRARARTEEAELRRSLRAAAEADRLDLDALRTAAEEFARANLPPEVGGKYVGKVLALAQYDTKPTRQFPEGRRKAEFRKLMDDMDWAAMEARRARDRKALAELADRYRSRRNWKGVPVSLVPSVQRTVDRIAEVLRMSDAAVDALMAHHVGLAMQLETSEDGRVYDGQRGWSRAELDEDMAILQEYGRLGASPDSKAATALADLRRLAETGKADYAQKIAERTERRKQSAAKLKAELTGTRNVKGRAAEGSDGGRLDSPVLLNHLTTRSCFSFLAGEANMGEGFDGTEAGRLYALVEKSSYGEMTRLRQDGGRFNDAVVRISGARTMKERKAWWHKVRDVHEHTGIFVDFYSSEYGSREDGTSFFRQGVRKGQRLAVDAEAARRALDEFERTGSATVDTEAGVRRLDEVSAGFLRRQLADFDAGLESDVQFSPDEAENDQIKAELAQLRKDGKVQVLLPSKDEVAVRRELALSQGQALQAWLTWRQEDCRAGMRWNGWNDESIRQLEAFLDPQVRAMGEWMRAEFRAGRAELDQAAFEKFGAHLPDNEDYFPTRYARNQGAGLSERGGKAATITPGFLASRKFHTLPIDLTQDAFQVFAGAMRDQAHFLAWGTTLDEINGVLGQGDVQEAIRNRYSQAFLDKLKDRVQLLRGGQDAGERLDFWLGAATHVFAASKLGFNFVSAAKQWLGTFAYLNDCSPSEMARALGTAFLNLGDRDLYRRFAKAALESDYLKNRLEGGMDRDLRYVLASAKATGLEGECHPLAEKAVQWMYALPQYADRLSTLTGGYAVFLHNYEGALKAGESDATAFERGMRAWMRSTDETQQSAYLKDQNSYQNSRGGLYRALTLFMSNPIQVSNRELVAFREAWEKGGRTWSGFAKTLAPGNPDGAAARRAILANHLVVPALMLLASGLLKYGLLDYWDEAEAEDYIVDSVMGSWDSVAISGGVVKNGLRTLVRAMEGEGVRFGHFMRGNSYAPGADELMDNLSAILRSGGNLKDDWTSGEDWLNIVEESLETAGMVLPGVGAVPVAGSAALHQARRAERMLRDEETLKAEKKERAKAKARRTREKNKAKKQEK
ncbi:MAG: hypothetical protein II943_00415 [Victivallales bacterium]|nr:hypothetical protein [Victivallales bacterium]